MGYLVLVLGVVFAVFGALDKVAKKYNCTKLLYLLVWLVFFAVTYAGVANGQ